MLTPDVPSAFRRAVCQQVVIVEIRYCILEGESGRIQRRCISSSFSWLNLQYCDRSSA